MARSTAAGVLVAPLAAPAIIGSLILLALVWSRPELNALVVFVGIMVAGGIYFATIISYAVMVLAFLPLALWFSRHGWVRAWHHAVLGLVLGILPFVTWFLACRMISTGATASSNGAAAQSFVLWCGLGALCGLASGLVYWLLAVRGLGAGPKGRSLPDGANSIGRL